MHFALRILTDSAETEKLHFKVGHREECILGAGYAVIPARTRVGLIILHRVKGATRQAPFGLVKRKADKMARFVFSAIHLTPMCRD